MAENIYNFDEKWFMIRVRQAVKYIMTRKKLQHDKIIRVSQNRNRE